MGDKDALVDLIRTEAGAVVKAALDDNQRKFAELYNEHKTNLEKRGLPDLEPGIGLARFAKAVLNGNNDPERARAWAEKAYPEDKALAGYFKAMSAGTGTEGGFIVPDVLSSEMVSFLYAKLAIMKLGARTISMPNGNINLPRFDVTSSATYIGENKPIVKTQPSLGNIKMSGKKLAAIVPISNDLIRSSDRASDAFIRDDLVMVLRLKMDKTGFYGLGTNNTPLGLDGILTSNEKKGSSSTPLTADVLGDLLGELWAKDVPMISCGWAMSGRVASWIYNLKATTGQYLYRAEMDAGKILGYPFVISNQINFTAGSPGYGDIWFGDFSEFIYASQMDMELVASREATYIDDGGNAVSAFANDQTVLRALSVHDFGIRHRESFVKGTYKLALS